MMQGWVSPAYMKREPAPVLGLQATTKGSFDAITLFEWENDSNPLVPMELNSTELSLLEGLGDFK